jgi:peptidyl-prolyl cis-trans isomerase A (cyclophilin A)
LTVPRTSEKKLVAMKKLIAVQTVALALAACESSPPEPEPTRKSPPAASGALDLGARGRTGSSPAPTPPAAAKPRVIPAQPVAKVEPSPDDPLKGEFSLADATKGLAGKGPLTAEIKTSKGTLECELFEDKAPITVANFVGLARGKRPWKNPDKKWVKKPGYDGTTFHRVVKGFMIQGGDPAGTGAGEPGYVIPDEVWEGAAHDQRGLLCMANRGKNTNGMQFFITDGAAPHLDGGYTIFGKCGPDSVITELASVSVAGDRAVEPPKIDKVTIRRKPAPAKK